MCLRVRKITYSSSSSSDNDIFSGVYRQLPTNKLGVQTSIQRGTTVRTTQTKTNNATTLLERKATGEANLVSEIVDTALESSRPPVESTRSLGSSGALQRCRDPRKIEVRSSSPQGRDEVATVSEFGASARAARAQERRAAAWRRNRDRDVQTRHVLGHAASRDLLSRLVDFHFESLQENYATRKFVSLDLESRIGALIHAMAWAEV